MRRALRELHHEAVQHGGVADCRERVARKVLAALDADPQKFPIATRADVRELDALYAQVVAASRELLRKTKELLQKRAESGPWWRVAPILELLERWSEAEKRLDKRLAQLFAFLIAASDALWYGDLLENWDREWQV
jgi:hypothetical protein